MTNEKCPNCNLEMVRTRSVGNFFYLHCWNCHKDFTKNLLFELKEIKTNKAKENEQPTN